MYIYNRTPATLPTVETKYRKIKTALPVPESLPILEKLEKYEPQSMLGQPPLIWDKAEGFQVYDKWGNVWLDWSSGVLITNAGHAHPYIVSGLRELIDQKLLATYVFYHEQRAELVELLAKTSPEGLDKVFLLSTGSEATENAIKLARTYGVQKGGHYKHVIVSFSNAFHGRTLGAQMAGGGAAQKAWIINQDPGFINVPFPDGFFIKNPSFDTFLTALTEAGVDPKNVAGVITESYQGAGPFFLPEAYAKDLAAFCHNNDALLICDEVQAGFGRTGKWFTFEHYGIVPDLIACGKGISSSLPLAAVIGRAEIMNMYKPGSMTSTHSASPLPVVAGLMNLRAIIDEGMVSHAAKMEHLLQPALMTIQEKFPDNVGFISCKGMVAGLLMVRPGTNEPDAATALKINEKCFQRGLLMFAPVGVGGQCIKISPPLVTPEDALREGLQVLAEVFDEVLD